MYLNDIQPQTKNCRRLAEAWSQWRGDKLLPNRSDMQLADIVQILPYVSLVDVISETELTFRLAGTMVRDLMGIELTGRNLLDLTEPEYRAKRGAQAMQNARMPCGALWIWNIAFAGGENRQTENMSLPVMPDELGRPLQMLSVFEILKPRNLPLAVDQLQQVASSEHHDFIDIGTGITPSA